MAHKFYDHMVHVLIFDTYEYHIDNKSILNNNIFKVFKLVFHSLRLNTTKNIQKLNCKYSNFCDMISLCDCLINVYLKLQQLSCTSKGDIKH